MSRPIRAKLFGALLAWLVVVGLVTFIFLNVFYNKPPAKVNATEALQFDFSAKYAVAMHRLLSNPATDAQLLTAVDAAAKTPAQKLHAAIVAGEMIGPDEAVRRIQALRAGAPETVLPGPDKENSVAPGPSTRTATDKAAAALERTTALPPVSPDDEEDEPAAARERGAEAVYQDAAAFETAYRDPAAPIDDSTRAGLLERHQWYAESALSLHKPNDPLRQRYDEGVLRSQIGFGVGLSVVGFGLLGSVVLVILAIVLLCLGKIKPGLDAQLGSGRFAPVRVRYQTPPAGYAAAYSGVYPPPPVYAPAAPIAVPPGIDYAGPALEETTARGVANPGVYIETFALYLALFMGGGLILKALGITRGAAAYGAMLVMILVVSAWPVLRGAGIRPWRLTMGIHKGRGFFREIFAGVAGYLVGLPVMAAGLYITTLLVKWSGANASHPLNDEAVTGWKVALGMYLMASGFAPITEELMFRGALLGHLRGKLGAFLAAFISSVIFASIHPQGWAAIPGLASIGFVLALIRQWRGSLIASTVAHGLHNGLLVTLMVWMMS